MHLVAAGATALAITPFFRGVLSLREAAGTVFCMALIGAVTGFLVGLSQTPVVAAIVPAVLSLLSGLVLIVVAREGESGARLLTAAAAAALVLNLLLGSLWGARVREAPDAVGSPTRNAEGVARMGLRPTVRLRTRASEEASGTARPGSQSESSRARLLAAIRQHNLSSRRKLSQQIVYMPSLRLRYRAQDLSV